jgi:hypothetical protein
MQAIITHAEYPPMFRTAGRVGSHTLARWALVRQIAELEEALADSYHCADRDSTVTWIESAHALLAEKRVALSNL